MKKIIVLIILTLILSACNQEEIWQIEKGKVEVWQIEMDKNEEYNEEIKSSEKKVETENIKISFEKQKLIDYDNCILDKEKFEILEENTDIFNYDDFCIPKYELIWTIKSWEPDEIVVRSCWKDNPYTLKQFNKWDESFVYNISKNNWNYCNDFEFRYFLDWEKLGGESYFLKKDDSVEYVFEDGELVEINNTYYKVEIINWKIFILSQEKIYISIVFDIIEDAFEIYNFNINDLERNIFNKMLNNEVKNIWNWYFQYESKLYYQWNLLKGIDIKSFEIIYCQNPFNINICLIKDENNIYTLSDGFIKIVDWADTKTFKILNIPYSKDKNYVYFYWSKIEWIKSENFEFVSDNSSSYFIYNDNLYKFNNDHEFDTSFKIVEEVDINSFEVINNRYSKDKNHVYRYWEILEWVDPETFQP